MVTFGGYFMNHLARKSYSTVKQQIQNDAGFSATILSAMDTTFMFTYAAGNVVNGKLVLKASLESKDNNC